VKDTGLTPKVRDEKSRRTSPEDGVAVVGRSLVSIHRSRHPLIFLFFFFSFSLLRLQPVPVEIIDRVPRGKSKMKVFRRRHPK